MRKFSLVLALLLLLSLAGCTLDLDVVQPTQTAATAPAESTGLTVHFIDVGQADCALLECDGAYMLIDGGNVEDGSVLVSYLQKLGVEELDTVVCTHAHEDHVGGLPAALAVYPTGTVYAPTRTYSSSCFDDFMYYVNQQGLEVVIPDPGDSWMLGSCQVTVLGPVQSYADVNNTSIVLRVDYGTTSFLFTGDMESDAESDLLDSGANVRADVLKVGHHGSNTSSSYRFLYEVAPTYGIISVGQGNSYGHPHEEPMSRLEDAGVTLYRTDTMGTILVHSDGETLTFTTEKDVQPVVGESQPVTQVYIGNLNSKKFHTESCSGLPAEKNRIYFETYEEAIAQGYTPCSNCLG